VILSRGHLLADYYVYDIKTSSLQKLLEADSAFADFPVSSILTQKESKLIIVYSGSFLNRKYFSLDLSDKIKIDDITALFLNHPEKVAWDKETTGNIIYIYRGDISRIDIQNKAVYPDYAKDVTGCGIHDGWIYMLTRDYELIRSTLDRSKEETALSDERFSSIISSMGKDFYNIGPFVNSLIFLEGSDKGSVFFNKLPYLISQDSIKGIRFYSPKNKLLLWTKRSVGFVDFSGEAAEGLAAIDYPGIKWVYKNGKDITQCFWTYEDSHVLVCDNNSVLLIELDPQGNHRLESIVGVKRGTSIFYSEQTGNLYFLEQPGGKFRYIKIVPRSGLIPENVVEK